MAQAKDIRRGIAPEEAATVLFCLVDDAYRLLNLDGRRYEALKKLSDSEVLTLALLQQLRGVESRRLFLRDAGRFFAHLFPGVAGLTPSSMHRCVRKLRAYLEPLRRAVAAEFAGNPETLVGLATRIAAKICAYNTYGLYVNRLLERPQGYIKELWA